MVSGVGFEPTLLCSHVAHLERHFVSESAGGQACFDVYRSDAAGCWEVVAILSAVEAVL